jgi:hypothetical protein
MLTPEQKAAIRAEEVFRAENTIVQEKIIEPFRP